jgi:hypothetical protein
MYMLSILVDRKNIFTTRYHFLKKNRIEKIKVPSIQNEFRIKKKNKKVVLINRRELQIILLTTFGGRP